MESNLCSGNGGEGISMLPPRMSASPKRAARRRLFPEPVLPDITLWMHILATVALWCEGRKKSKRLPKFTDRKVEIDILKEEFVTFILSIIGRPSNSSIIDCNPFGWRESELLLRRVKIFLNSPRADVCIDSISRFEFVSQ